MRRETTLPYACVLAILIAMSGCTSTTVVFRMTPDAGWHEEASGCAGPLGSFSQTLEEGVVIALVPKPSRSDPPGPKTDTQLVWVFMLDRGHTIRLLGKTVTVTLPDGSRIDEALPDFRNEDRWVTSDTLLRGDRGNGRAHIARSGQVEGDADYYVARIRIAPEVINRFAVRLPDFEVNGRRRSLGDQTFEKKSVRFVQCIQ